MLKGGSLGLGKRREPLAYLFAFALLGRGGQRRNRWQRGRGEVRKCIALHCRAQSGVSKRLASERFSIVGDNEQATISHTSPCLNTSIRVEPIQFQSIPIDSHRFRACKLATITPGIAPITHPSTQATYNHHPIPYHPLISPFLLPSASQFKPRLA